MTKVLQSLPDRYRVRSVRLEYQMKWSYGVLSPLLWWEAYILKLLSGFHEAGVTSIEDEKPRKAQSRESDL